MHVLSTPPAFVLSQDQTLHRDSCAGPEGPTQRIREPAERTQRSDRRQTDGRAPRSTPGGLPLLHYFDVRPRDVRPEPPALAFGSRSSVFKERPGTRPGGRRCRFRSGRGEEDHRGSLRLAERLRQGRFGGMFTLPAAQGSVNRPREDGPAPVGRWQSTDQCSCCAGALRRRSTTTPSRRAHFQRKWTKILPKFFESFSTRW